MRPDTFRSTLVDPGPPPGLSDAVEALWWDGKSDWDRAHQCAQQDDGPAGCAVHAYLHRKEGDLSNARYWYSRAGRAQPESSLQEEWESLVEELSGGSPK